MATPVHPDAQRLAKRFHEVWQALDPPGRMLAKKDFHELPLEYRLQLMATFDEMLRSELVFGGPSLYAEPSV